MSTVQKTITINWSGLSKKTKILFAFSDIAQNITLDNNSNYVGWKVIGARPGDGSATIVYSGDVGFAQTTEDIGNVVRGSSFIKLPLANSVILQPPNPGEGSPKWGPIKPLTDPKVTTRIQAMNATPDKQDLSVGTFRTSKNGVLSFDPIFVWKDVRKGDTVEAQFTSPLALKAYADVNYNGYDLLTEDISDKQVFFEDVAELEPNTTYDFIESEKPDVAFEFIKVQM